MTAAAAPADATPARLRLRSQIAQAARLLTPTWPIDTFIAVNPLGGLEDRPFADAIRLAGELFGARGTLHETDFRAAYQTGRITDRDLLAALLRRDSTALNGSPLDLGAGSVTAAQLCLADLLHGTPAPGPDRRALTRSAREAPQVASTVNQQSTKWCAAFLDTGQAAWPMPGRQHGFYRAWRDLAHRDRTLPRPTRGRLRALPARGDDACLAALDALAIVEPDHVDYLQAHLTALPGWAGHIRWRAQQTAQQTGQGQGEHQGHEVSGGRIDLLDYLAVRLSYEAALLTDRPRPQVTVRAPAPQAETPERRARRVAEALGVQASDAQVTAAALVLARLPVRERELVWLEAYEAHYRDDLLAQLSGRPPAGAPLGASTGGRPAAQLICCIDARSEGLRRHAEAVGNYATLGFAGFFAVAVRYQDLAGGATSALCPVLLAPRNTITELPAEAPERAARQLAGRRALAGAEAAFHTAKDGTASPFALAEAAGWAAGPLAAAKTLAPGPTGALRRRLHRRAAPAAPTTLSIDGGFTADERVLFATAALTMMGLHSGFARLVVLCGHGSTTENNPYAAALDCGACGGHRGGPNARTAATILNRPDVRSQLAQTGITIPGDTWFVAAEHDTAHDHVEVLDRHLVPATHHSELDQLATDLATAGARLSAERCATLPGVPTRSRTPLAARRHVRTRSRDWAQVYPEWGLAGNAAFIIGPRAITASLNLRRRTFLHSYDAALDPDGAALETILTAPLVVAQWINCQYYFSAVDPTVFGAGTKTIHNVVGGVGVLSGHDGDLQPGLPWQSVAAGSQLIHEPVRLLAVVQAPLDRIASIVARNTVLTQLVGNDWVGLAAREQTTDPWSRHTPHGWQPWTTPKDTG